VDRWLNIPSTRFSADNPAEHFYDHAIRFKGMFAQPSTRRKLHVYNFTRTHLPRLLSVPELRRTALKRAAIRQRWSVRRLRAEIAGRCGTRRAG
jgi:hypothetical protein